MPVVNKANARRSGSHHGRALIKAHSQRECLSMWPCTQRGSATPSGAALTEGAPLHAVLRNPMPSRFSSHPITQFLAAGDGQNQCSSDGQNQCSSDGQNQCSRRLVAAATHTPSVGWVHGMSGRHGVTEYPADRPGRSTRQVDLLIFEARHLPMRP
eukprot:354441-Chlamydomonas_euryale.AAC.4